MVRKCLCLFALLLVSNGLFAISRLHEAFVIDNRSSSSITVNTEFLYNSENATDSSVWWKQIVHDIPLAITDMLAVYDTNIIPPNVSLDILQFYTDSRFSDELIAMPIISRLEAIFERLEIIHDDGRETITLENLSETDFVRIIPWHGRVLYVLEIFDPDTVEGSNASSAR